MSSSKRTLLNQTIGNIKRIFPKGAFNPFSAMEYVFDNCLSNGEGHQVLVLGHSDIFKNNTIRAAFHVMADRGHLAEDVAPKISASIGTKTGTTIKCLAFADDDSTQQAVLEACASATYIVVCDRFESIAINLILKDYADLASVVDVSQNNA